MDGTFWNWIKVLTIVHAFKHINIIRREKKNGLFYTEKKVGVIPSKIASLSSLVFEKEKVYEPSDDSYLFMDVLTSEADRLKSWFPKGSFCLEIGGGILLETLFFFFKKKAYYIIGSGILSATLNNCYSNQHFFHVVTDINENAARMCSEAIPKGETILCDLHFNFQAQFDVVFFNPPYA